MAGPTLDRLRQDLQHLQRMGPIKPSEARMLRGLQELERVERVRLQPAVLSVAPNQAAALIRNAYLARIRPPMQPEGYVDMAVSEVDKRGSKVMIAYAIVGLRDDGEAVTYSVNLPSTTATGAYTKAGEDAADWIMGWAERTPRREPTP